MSGPGVAARVTQAPLSELVHCGTEMIRVRELTVAEVRAWLNESAAQTWRDPILALALDDIGLDELARMLDRSVEDLERYAPSQIAEVVAVARRLNPHFFKLRDALIKASRAIDNTTESSNSAVQEAVSASSSPV